MFKYIVPITIDHTKCGSGDSTNFPILISGTYAILKTVGNGGNVENSNGYDIGFYSDPLLLSKLSWETELYTAASGLVLYWVKVPTLSSSVDTVIYMGVGDTNITTDQGNATGVWHSGFKAVYHLGDGSSVGLSDSTSNARTLTNNNSATAVSGKINGAVHFNGSNQWLSNSGVQILSSSNITVSWWQKVLTADVKASAGFNIGNSDNPNRILAHSPWSDSTIYWDYGSYSGGGRVSGSYASYLDKFSLIHLVFANSSSLHGIYIDGSLRYSATNSNKPTSTQTGLEIARWAVAGYEKGDYDEFRVQNVPVSADWVTAEYNNQNSPSTFYSVGSLAPFTRGSFFGII